MSRYRFRRPGVVRGGGAKQGVYSISAGEREEGGRNNLLGTKDLKVISTLHIQESWDLAGLPGRMCAGAGAGAE
jgi:hypothetical protein